MQWISTYAWFAIHKFTKYWVAPVLFFCSFLFPNMPQEGAKSPDKKVAIDVLKVCWGIPLNSSKIFACLGGGS